MYQFIDSDDYIIKSEMRRWRTNKTFWIYFAKITVVVLILIILWKLIPNHLIGEIRRSYFEKEDVVIIGQKIEQRTSTLDIGILVILSEDVNLNEYELALKTLKCYTLLHNYSFRIEYVNNQWHKLCPQKQFMFQRHCITSYLLQDHEWTLFIDADVGVINPNKLLDNFIIENKNNSDVIFFDRFFNWEIAAGSYLAKNTDYSKEFLLKFAQLEYSLPQSFTGSDNGAIHWLFVKEFYDAKSTSIQSPNDCYKVWSKSVDFDDLYVFEACCRSIMGENRVFFDENNKGSIKILKKGTGWMRDGWLLDSRWSLDDDFILHGWKHSILVPYINESSSWERAKIKNKWGKWYNPLAINDFPENLCISGNITWKYWKSLMFTSNELDHELNQKNQLIQKDFYYYISLVPSYL